MATVVQTWDGAKIVAADQSTITSEYNIFDESDEFQAEIALNAATPTTFGAWKKSSVSIDSRVSADTWRGTVEWSGFATKEIGDSSYTFNTGGGTAHVATSLDTLSATPAPGVAEAPDFDRCINVDDDSVGGIDIVTPRYVWTEKHFLAAATVTDSYKLTLFSLTGAWNNSTFKDFAVGECMFLGAAGSLRDYTTWEITYNFESVPNRTSFEFGSITVPLKRGFDYVWGRYVPWEDAAAGRMGRVAIAAYVEQVSPAGNLALLGIGS